MFPEGVMGTQIAFWALGRAICRILHMCAGCENALAFPLQIGRSLCQAGAIPVRPRCGAKLAIATAMMRTA